MEVKFREAKFDDIPMLVSLCNECFDEDTNIERAKDIFLKTQGDDTQIYLIGEVNDDIVAHAKITIVSTMYEKTDVFALLNHVCVKYEYRGYGIATKMLIECEKISREKGCSEMRLWSTNFRQAAHACYKKYGFEEANAQCFFKKVEKEL